MKGSMLLGDIAEQIPASTTLLRKYNLDFCCGGKQTLEEACRFQKLDMEQILKEINEIQSASKQSDLQKEWREAPLAAITHHLENHYHARHRLMLPELRLLADKVERVHQGHADCPVGLAQFLDEMNTELTEHMSKEEMILFPMINAGNGAMAVMPIHVMTAEHDQHGQSLAKLKVLAFNFNPPLEACGTWRALYKGLDQLEQELMEHIHLENHILFARALQGKN